MNTYSGLRGWLKKLRHYEDELFGRPGDPPFPYVPEEHGYGTSNVSRARIERFEATHPGKSWHCRYGDPPFKPGVWIEMVFQPHNQALDELARLAVNHPELARQIRDALNRAETAYARFAEVSTVFEPLDSVMLESYPANDADRGWSGLQDPIRDLQRRLTAALQAIDEPDQLAAETNQRPTPEAFLSASQLAKAFGVKQSPLESRLKRWRKANAAGDDWIQHDKPAANEPKYLYRVGAVKELISELKPAADSD